MKACKVKPLRRGPHLKHQRRNSPQRILCQKGMMVLVCPAQLRRARRRARIREAQQKHQELQSEREALRHKAQETRAAEQVRRRPGILRRVQGLGCRPRLRGFRVWAAILAFKASGCKLLPFVPSGARPSARHERRTGATLLTAGRSTCATCRPCMGSLRSEGEALLWHFKMPLRGGHDGRPWRKRHLDSMHGHSAI